VLSFAPDVIISQHGCDSHAWDPLTHLALTLHGIQAQMQLAHQLAHTYCGGRWVALGGGGYDQFRVVPRAWSILWAEMSQQPLPEQLPEGWIARWRPEWERVQEQEGMEQQVMGKVASTTQFPRTFQDRAEDFPPKPRRAAIAQANRRTAMLARHLLLPVPIRKAFATSPGSLHLSPMTGLFDLLHTQGGESPSRSAMLETARGTLLLRDFCPPSLIERLVADSGLHAFARVPEREHELLLNISRNPDCVLTVAHTPAGEIVGQVTLAFGDEWWEGLDNAYEVTIEVSSQWRGIGLARTLLAFALERAMLEDMILFAMGLSWHWDYEGLHLTPYRYRQLISHLFATQGFTEQTTTEPDIRMDPANVLLVRAGSRVDSSTAQRFFKRIHNSPRLSRG
ncbi:MAG TPA: GNAT family N-acetyltransferase, partial [Ktedonobacteraceae bacterium]|nr:GNAT family N-acetyltransferase [Ktedonobacteraceae bacterium]